MKRLDSSLSEAAVGPSLGCHDGRRPARHESGFTMVEIALCLAVVGFALVSIIGVLPIGMRVQGENREETFVNADGIFLLESIRSGSRGLDYLTNHFDSITVSNSLATTVYTYSPKRSPDKFSNGSQIMGLLSTPRYFQTPQNRRVTNTVSAIVRSINGSALTQSREGRDLAFTYRLIAEMTPLNIFPPVTTNLAASGLSQQEFLGRSNNWRIARNLSPNFHELRLTLQWPVYQQGNRLQIGSNRKTLRTLVNGRLASDFSEGLFHVQPSQYERAPLL